MDVQIGTIIREQRKALGLEQSQLAQRIGVSERQIGRYEAEDPKSRQEPTATVCRKLAQVLGISLAQLFGEVPISLDLGGRWFAAWQTSRGLEPVVDRHGITASHAGDRIVLNADGDYLWSGDLRIIDGSLLGTYRSTEHDKLFRGALYFLLAEDSTAAIGRWTGLWADGLLGSGWGVLARDEARAGRLLDLLMTTPEPITAWPQED